MIENSTDLYSPTENQLAAAREIICEESYDGATGYRPTIVSIWQVLDEMGVAITPDANWMLDLIQKL